MQKIPLKSKSEKYIYFDFETLLNEKNEHVVNLAISKYLKSPELIKAEKFAISESLKKN